ncbi:FG-GAP repeat domain-containing protein [Streptomyces sp. NPDC021224]|uniref:FG-GAP repeat domain-containing protein n=1 Tax=unclassified Streptomyces TaxID=2593676 RepID=UPI00378E2EF3
MHPTRIGRRVTAKILTVAAGSLALALGASVTANASQGAAGKAEAAQRTHSAVTAFTAAPPEDTWSFSIDGRDSAGDIWSYAPKSGGGFQTRVKVGSGMGSASALFKNDPAGDGTVYPYALIGTQLRVYKSATSGTGTLVGSGWDVYNTFVTPGNIGGSASPDLLARDKSGVLWEYLSNTSGTFAARIKVGSGWGAYSQIAGRDDLTGDGKADIVARDTTGTLWLYKGTGNSAAPFAARTKIGTGWNTYNKLIGLGDTNADGHNDLIARDTKGVLWLYQGTGDPSAPYQGRVQIGTSWNSYNYLF